MPPLDFPNSPALNQLYAGPNNVQWQWDGSKWLGTPNTLGPIIVAASPPTFVSGQLWWDSTGGNLYLAYDDGNTQQWVPASNITGLANAATTMDVDKALGNVGRNLIHNSLFGVAQRGYGPWTTNVYTADRWLMAATTDTVSVTIPAATDTDRAQIGDETANTVLQNTFTGTASAGSLNQIQQPVEALRRFGGKTVILSFYAKGTGATKLGLNLYMSYGSGGSPSAGVFVAATGTPVTISSTWTRVSAVFTVPSTAGKTFGTNANDALMVCVGCSSGATWNASFGNIGVQSGTVNLWGVQLEIVQPGQTVPTKLEKRDPVLELQQCQRFACVMHMGMQPGTITSGAGYQVPFPVPMRGTPTPTNISAGNVGTATFMSEAAFGNTGAFLQLSTSTAGGYIQDRVTLYSADL